MKFDVIKYGSSTTPWTDTIDITFLRLEEGKVVFAQSDCSSGERKLPAAFDLNGRFAGKPVRNPDIWRDFGRVLAAT